MPACRLQLRHQRDVSASRSTQWGCRHVISVDYSLFRMQLDDCLVAYPDLISWIMCCAMTSTGCQSSRESFQGRGVWIQGHPWPRASLLEETVCSRVKCSGIESKQICIPWRLHRSNRNKEHHLPSTKFCSGGTYLVELLPSGIRNSSSMQTFRSRLNP